MAVLAKPLAALTATFSPMPRKAPPPLGREIAGSELDAGELDGGASVAEGVPGFGLSGVLPAGPGCCTGRRSTAPVPRQSGPPCASIAFPRQYRASWLWLRPRELT